MKIFIMQNGNQLGPYSIEEVKARMERGEISTSDEAWRKGCPDWVRISDMPELHNQPSSCSIPTEGSKLPQDSGAAVSSASNNNNRFWPGKPTDWKEWLFLTILSSPVWGLAVVFVCLGRWSYVIWETIIIGSIALIFTGLDSELVGSKLFNFGRNHFRVSGMIVLIIGALVALVGIVLGLFALDSTSDRPWTFAVASFMTLGAAFRCIKVGWNGISARKNR